MDQIPNKNPSDRNGETPLHIAAKSGDDILVSLVMDHVERDDINFGLGSTPLHLAAKNNHTEVYRIMINR